MTITDPRMQDRIASIHARVPLLRSSGTTALLDTGCVQSRDRQAFSCGGWNGSDRPGDIASLTSPEQICSGSTPKKSKRVNDIESTLTQWASMLAQTSNPCLVRIFSVRHDGHSVIELRTRALEHSQTSGGTPSEGQRGIRTCGIPNRQPSDSRISSSFYGISLAWSRSLRTLRYSIPAVRIVLTFLLWADRR
jgi:hypothetical protein